MQFKVESRLVLREIINVCCNYSNRGINFILSALVFNIFPTIFEVLLVSGILVSFLHLEELAIRKKNNMDDFIHNSMNTQVGIRLSISWSIMQALLFPSQKQAMNEAFLILFF